MAGFALRVATFNIRNLRDHYAERWPLLREAFLGLDAGIVGLQEVGIEARPADEHDGVHGGSRQDDALMAAAPAHRYRSSVAPYQQWKGFGLATLQRAGEILVHEQLALSHGRVAQRLLIALPGARTLWFANTHLHNPLTAGNERIASGALVNHRAAIGEFGERFALHQRLHAHIFGGEGVVVAVEHGGGERRGGYVLVGRGNGSGHRAVGGVAGHEVERGGCEREGKGDQHGAAYDARGSASIQRDKMRVAV